MPWKVKKDARCPDSQPWAVVNSDTNRLVSCHLSQDSARQQQKALYANVPESGRELVNNDALELANELADRLDQGHKILSSMDQTNAPDAVTQALPHLTDGKQLCAQIIAALQDEEGIVEDDGEAASYARVLGLPYIVVFHYRSDEGPSVVGPFPTRVAAQDHVLGLEPFEADYEYWPISRP